MGWPQELVNIAEIFIIQERNVKFDILIERMKIMIFYLCVNFYYLRRK